MKKFRVLLLLILFAYSCSSYKLKFGPTSPDSANKISKSFKFLKPDQLFLSFTKGFHQTKIKVVENGTKIFDSIISTDERHIAKSLKVNVNSSLIISFENQEKPLFISKTQMNNYKFIWIEKKWNKYVVEFYNGTKDLGGK